MAGTQQLPSWMTLSMVVITNAEGQPVTTSTTTLQLPLTYYGPSIPLGTDGAWTYGGLTPPASTTSSVSSTATPTSTSFTSASSTFTPTTMTTTTPTSTLTSSPASSSVTTTSASSTPSPSSTSSTLSKGAIIGIVFGAFVFFVLLMLLLICFLRWRARRRDSGYRQTPIWTHWEVVRPSGQHTGTDEDRPAGVGSPRDSGEEADSFLQRSAGATDGTRGASSTVRPVSSLPPGAAPPRIIGSTHSGDSGQTSSSAVTDYGVLLPHGGPIGQAYRDEGHPPARPSSEMTGHIIPPGELLRIDDEERPESPPRMYNVPRISDPLLPDAFSPLLPPPPLEIDRISYRRPSSMNEKEKSVRTLSYPASDMEDSKVYTARRVRVQELGPRSPTEDETSSHTHAEAAPVAGPSSWRNSWGLGSIARLRKSWFGGSSSGNTSKSSQGRVRSDDAEAGQSLLAPPTSRSRGGLGLTVEGERPMSSISTKSAVSGNTVYHDAVSRLGTPVSVPSRAMTPASGGGAALGSDFVPPLPTGAPPAYTLSDPYESVGSRASFPYSQGLDVLDLPVPEPASPFAGVSGTARGTPFPPGLGGSRTRSWRDSLSDLTGSSNEAGITIDVLDAEPPRAGERWRSMAGGLVDVRRGGSSAPDLSERRTTFGTPQLVHQRHPMLSEQGSLHSMRSYLSPLSRSSGSGPVSSAHSQGLTGSSSSRPSAHSRIQTASSGSVRSGSLSSGQRLADSGLPISPAISAFGTGVTESGRLSREMEELPSPLFEEPNRISILGPMPSFTARSVRTSPTIRSVGATTTSDETEVTRTTVTTGTGTSGGTLVDSNDDGDDLVERFRLGKFDFEHVRV
ncbi:hypothetical protein F5I97DRAFT_1516225 [Phlebopus sp. FC_14]|nr:hypothetical protein F5I97DRAFT_1516225 [Phlebopus sp. FC_14]